ncbi:PREDICTED: glutamic acid-rich protein-like [Trachymyrmex septentrionalis]|uniref:glutamic acid-rich protein-like n=1 Tax=Trachymyrmex septentrionalis TaxID=34720 RepID=UPI00084F5B4E|nr:PREDICTED: glutamic acid-rich protein-like [Trachymyrmex septentrionalis]
MNRVKEYRRRKSIERKEYLIAKSAKSTASKEKARYWECPRRVRIEAENNVSPPRDIVIVQEIEQEREEQTQKEDIESEEEEKEEEEEDNENIDDDNVDNGDDTDDNATDNKEQNNTNVENSLDDNGDDGEQEKIRNKEEIIQEAMEEEKNRYYAPLENEVQTGGADHPTSRHTREENAPLEEEFSQNFENSINDEQQQQQ